MSQSKSSRRRRGKKPKAVDLWKPVPPLDPPEPIRIAATPTAVVESLGDPPLKGQGDNARRNIYLVVTEAAKSTQGLAALAGLLALPDDHEA